MNHFELTLTLKNNPERHKRQSIEAKNMCHAIVESERLNPGYIVTEIKEYSLGKENEDD